MGVDHVLQRRADAQSGEQQHECKVEDVVEHVGEDDHQHADRLVDLDCVLEQAEADGHEGGREQVLRWV